MKNHRYKYPMALCIGLAIAAPAVQASHFRGGAIVPEIDANKILKVTGTSFWRPAAPTGMSGMQVIGSVSGVIASFVDPANINNTSDSRFTVITETFSLDLSTRPAQTFTIQWSSCCRVAGIVNMPGEPTESLRSTIVWDGTSATKPIDFNFASIQPEVSRIAAYNDNLGAVSPNGNALSYVQTIPKDQNFNNIASFSQPPGFTINAANGNLNIPAANTATYLDNPTANIGADYAFAGNIVAKNGAVEIGRIGFDWLFDAVNTAAVNNAPVVNDAVINALVGNVINHTFTGTDPDGQLLTWSFVNQLGSAPAIAPTFNPLTQQYSWNTAGSLPGQYIAQARASDGSLTDVGNLTINLSAPSQGVPDGGSSAFLLGLGVLGMLACRKPLSRTPSA